MKFWLVQHGLNISILKYLAPYTYTRCATKTMSLWFMMTLNTVEAGGCVVDCILTGCDDVDAGFADTVFTGLLSVTVIDGSLRHKCQPLLTTQTHSVAHSKLWRYSNKITPDLAVSFSTIWLLQDEKSPPHTFTLALPYQYPKTAVNDRWMEIQRINSTTLRNPLAFSLNLMHTLQRHVHSQVWVCFSAYWGQ